MAAEKYRELKAGEVVLPTDELYVGAPVNKWLCGSLNCGKELPAQYVGGYRRLKNVEGVQTQSGEAPKQQLKDAKILLVRCSAYFHKWGHSNLQLGKSVDEWISASV